MKFILNIGLKAGHETIAAHVAREVLASEDLLWSDEGRVIESDTEPTLVIEVSPLHSSPLAVLSAFRAVAVALEQDCIAVYRPLVGKGALVGPAAEKWGPFNPEFFILPDGTRLGARKEAA